MQIESPATFAAAIRAIEADLGLRYPSSAPELFLALSAIVGSSKLRGVFEQARLLVTSADVAAVRNEVGGRLIDGNLLPFLQVEEGQWPDLYGYDMGDPIRNRIAVYSVHTVVHDWPSPEAFLNWISATPST
jgi:hypothetical protein